MTSMLAGGRRAMPLAAALVVLGGLLVAGCNDTETYDHRGYTKAPLDHPAPVIRPEAQTAMSRIGRPAYDPVVILTPDSVGVKPK